MSRSITYPFFKAFDASGDPLVGGKAFTYGIGGVVKTPTFADYKKTQYSRNPVILNADAEARIYSIGFGPTGGGASLKIVTKDTDDATVWTNESTSNPPLAPPEARTDTFKAYDHNGNALAGGKLYTYVAGTSTEFTTYSDAALTTPNDNPVILDASGEADIFCAAGLMPKLVLKDSNDRLYWTGDFRVTPFAISLSGSLGLEGDVIYNTGPPWTLMVNLTDGWDASLNYTLNTIIYDIAQATLITGPDNEIWISTDAGVNWSEEATTAGNTAGGAHDVAHATNIVIGYARRIYVSSDGGGTWALEATLAGVSTSDGIDKVLYDPVNETLVAFVGLSGDPDTEIWQSTDGGYNWTLKDTLEDTWDVIGVTFDSDNNTILLLTGHLAGTSYAAKVWISSDGGATWVLKKDLKTDYSLNFVGNITYNSGDAELVITTAKATGNVLIWISSDGGSTWSQACDLGYEYTPSAHLVYSSSADKLYIRGSSFQEIHSSRSGGASWVLDYTFAGTSDTIYHMVYIPSLSAVLVGTTSGDTYDVKVWIKEE